MSFHIRDWKFEAEAIPQSVVMMLMLADRLFSQASTIRISVLPPEIKKDTEPVEL